MQKPKRVELTVRAKAEKEAAEMQAAAIVELAEATRKRVWRKQKHNVR
ncbi:Inner membrane protein yqiK [Escherichia coli]|uniref:Inner membrane protein yqiK n=1 Tax=Escherichia coli TaxID=562 RepID=A0A376ZJU7_ECOLX|nr:Inner membrane protein yqiK [Escherichia coli]